MPTAMLSPPRARSSTRISVTRERTPILTNVPYVGPHKDFLRVQDLIMPLSSDGRNVDILFAVVDFLRRD